MRSKTKVLFVCKRWIDGYGSSYGLINSALFVTNKLNAIGFEATAVAVIDANYIDAAVHKYNPDVVVLEALWVMPDKVKELIRLHHNKRWVVRVHSKIPFLACEGMGIELLAEYLKIDKLVVAFNNVSPHDNVNSVFGARTICLPNIYCPIHQDVPEHTVHKESKHHIDMACFGAIRPLKNHLNQAFAAIEYSKYVGKDLYFHINSTRQEMSGTPVLKNLRALFKAVPNAVLAEHLWVKHSEFIHLVRRMDFGLQVSYSESFNIIVADFVSNGVPIVVSDEVNWMPIFLKSDPNSVEDIVMRMKDYNVDDLHVAQHRLHDYNEAATKTWEIFLDHRDMPHDNEFFQAFKQYFWK